MTSPHPESHAHKQHQHTQMTQVPIMNPLMPGNHSMAGPDNPHLKSDALEQHQYTWTTQAPIANPLMLGADCTMTGPGKHPHNEHEQTNKVCVVEQSSWVPVCPYLLGKKNKKKKKTDSSLYSARKQYRCLNLLSRNTRNNFSTKPLNLLIRWSNNLKCARENLRSSIRIPKRGLRRQMSKLWRQPRSLMML